MFAFSSVILLLVVSFCHGQTNSERSCAPDTIDFASKVEKSSIVVYGKAMAKMLNDGHDETFHVFFQVDCILKGPATLRQINITNAGRASGKQYCQEFPVGRGYSIAFLEPSPVNESDHKTFVPSDFVEIVDDGKSIEQLLARTCSLHRLVPLHSLAAVTEICPAVATDPLCQSTLNATDITVVPLVLNTTLVAFPQTINNQTVLVASDVQGHLTKPINTPAQELDAIRSKSGIAQVDIDRQNAAPSLTFNHLLLLAAVALRAI